MISAPSMTATESSRPDRRLLLWYPWLGSFLPGTEYLPPEYYERILKPYVFSGISDLGLFRGFLLRNGNKAGMRALEIGPGTGRATGVVLGALDLHRLVLLDQSHRMIDFLRWRLGQSGRVEFVERDAVTYLSSIRNSYDLVFSLWGLSHSVHQTLGRLGLLRGSRRVYQALRDLFCRGLADGGYFYLVHFDSTSDEQNISLRQRSKITPWLQPGQQSPSKRLLDRVLERLQREGVVDFQVTHLLGDPVIYSDINEALEIFMNFHMEGYLNNSAGVGDVITELRRDLKLFEAPNKTIHVRPACFVYVCQKKPVVAQQRVASIFATTRGLATGWAS